MTPKLTYTATTHPNGDVTIVLGNWTGVYQRCSQQVFRATNSVYIYSCYTPEWSPGENFLYVHGRTAYADHIPIHIPAADWQRVKQALDEYGAVQTNAEQTKETKVEGKAYRVEEGDVAVSVRDQRDRAAAFFYLCDGATRADADEFCAKLNARAEAERKATEVRAERDGDGIMRLYVGDRYGVNYCVLIFPDGGSGLTPDQADQLSAATADALRKILRGEGAK